MVWKAWRSAVFLQESFIFPTSRRQQIAVETVKQFMNRNTGVKKVIFNVFKDLDKAIYEKLLRAD